MKPHPNAPRTPEQIRSGNRRIGLAMLTIAVAFFVFAVVRQWIASRA
ncbi:MAG: hypothetical protein GAK40_00508 [Burkholderia plantarii]|nr:MAG: hypothetical protein GAK40_00508 [Burkholderia plantarii]